jgi:hypothetical protein
MWIAPWKESKERTMSKKAKKANGERDELIELEHAFWDAMKVRDGKAAQKLTAEGCLVIGPQGIGEIGPAAIAKMVVDAPYEIESYGMADDKVHFRMVDDGVAVVAYEVDERLRVDGESTRIKAYDSSLWLKKGGKWVCAMHTETIAGDPFGRDRAGERTRAV